MHSSTAMTQTKMGSPFYLLSLSNMLDLIRCNSVHSSSLLYFDGMPGMENNILSVAISLIRKQKERNYRCMVDASVKKLPTLAPPCCMKKMQHLYQSMLR